MNRTALALLQGRLWRAAVDFDDRLNSGAIADSGTSTSGPRPLLDNERVAVPQHSGLQFELTSVLRALERIDQGLYGWCESCGEAIDPDRLFDRPQQIACTGCEGARPAAQGIGARQAHANGGSALHGS